jgi:hypothetical protein
MDPVHRRSTGGPPTVFKAGSLHPTYLPENPHQNTAGYAALRSENWGKSFFNLFQQRSF